MKRVADFPKVLLYREFADMRKQITGLSAMIEEVLGLSPFEPALFVFVNKRRDLMKAVYWDLSGFAMWVKRLDAEKFPWPKRIPDMVLSITPQQMEWLLEGYNIWEMKRHKELQLKHVS